MNSCCNFLFCVLIGYYDGNDAAFAADYDSYIIQTLGWLPNNDGGRSITMNCDILDEDGNPCGVILATTPNKTEFNFMLRPLALSQGFTIDVEFANGVEPLHIDRWANPDREYSIMPGIINCWNYTTAIEGVR